MLQACEAELVCAGSWQGGPARGGRGPRLRENDRDGQYGRPGNAWQPRSRTDDPGVPRAPQLADKLQGEALYGVNPVLGALQAMRRDCTTLYVQEGQSAPIDTVLPPESLVAICLSLCI